MGLKILFAAALLAVFPFAALVTLAAEPPAKQLFSAVAKPSEGAAESFGSYAKGCLAGGTELPETGDGWQAMRLSRNRNWGHPETIKLIVRLAAKARDAGWPGLLIGDISQPRGGPMRSGHRSHQIGLDADIWLRPAPGRTFTRQERERVSSTMVVAPDRKGVSASWTPTHHSVLRAAASDPAVARIFVNAAIKQEICTSTPAGDDRSWIRKVRPWWGHDSHFHVRLECPSDAQGCVPQPPIPAGDGCDETLAWWFSDEALNPKPGSGARARQALRLADLPLACERVLSE